MNKYRPGVFSAMFSNGSCGTNTQSIFTYDFSVMVHLANHF